MSGGEKSYATICLLLSLWEAISSPIRALDEFDVFMDSINRRISMKMMVGCASASANGADPSCSSTQPRVLIDNLF